MADRFEIMRQRIQQQGSAAEQNNVEAMRRRFASMGGLNSGAGIRAEQQVKQQVGAQTAQNLEGVDIQQAQDEAQKAEVEKQRQYATAEREAAQKFAQGERQAGQEFQAGQQAAAMKQQMEQFNKDYAFKKDQFEQAKSQFDRQLDWENQKFQYEKTVDDFNRGMSERIQKFNENQD